MAGSQRDRQRAARQSKQAALRAAQQRAVQRRKRRLAGGAVAVVIGLVGALILAFSGGGDDATDVATKGTSTTGGSSTTTATTALASVAGKPCVARSDPLPEGAPEVPVKVGPPPKNLVMEDLVQGTGAVVPPEATVTVNYIGVACSDGKIFDSSYATKQPVSFPLTQVIPGWTQGIPGMKVGGRRLLGIPSALAYGPEGNRGIAPDEALWFVVEVLDAKP